MIADTPRLPGGMHPSQKEGYDRSAALTLLDLRVEVEGGLARDRRRLPSDPAIEDSATICVRTTRGSFAEKFVTKAHGVLQDSLQRLHLTLRVEIDGTLLVAHLLDSFGAPIDEATARTHAAALEEALQQDGDAFHWEELCLNIVHESKALLGSLRCCDTDPAEGDWESGVRPNLDKEKIAAILPEKIVPCGLPAMEVGFSAGGTQILFPDPLAFGDEHWELWAKFSPYAATRGKLDFIYSALLWLPHEVLHCVQDGALGMVGAEKSEALHNWQCEYCVCFGQMLFVACLIGEHRKKGICRTLMVPSYFMEEVLLWADACRHAHPQEPADSWIACRGASPPHPEQPYIFMEEKHEEYLALLNGVLVNSFREYQRYVEQDDQITSYWAEFVKYVNRLLGTTSQEKIPEVTTALEVPASA